MIVGHVVYSIRAQKSVATKSNSWWGRALGSRAIFAVADDPQEQFFQARSWVPDRFHRAAVLFDHRADLGLRCFGKSRRLDLRRVHDREKVVDAAHFLQFALMQ